MKDYSVFYNITPLPSKRLFLVNVADYYLYVYIYKPNYEKLFFSTN